MRALLVLSIAVLVCLPFAAAAPNPIPSMTIKMDQSSQSVNATTANQSVTFTGSVSISKPTYLSATVTLTGAVDSGWQATVAPASMTFTSTTPQSFAATVVVPGGTAGGNESKLTISGVIVSGFLQSSTTASATILVVGTLPATNQTGNNTNGTKPNGNNQTVIPNGLTTTKGAPGFLGFSYEQWALISVVAVVVLVTVGVYARARRRRRAALEVETVEEV